jgi:hypothetical protein
MKCSTFSVDLIQRFKLDVVYFTNAGNIKTLAAVVIKKHSKLYYYSWLLAPVVQLTASTSTFNIYVCLFVCVCVREREKKHSVLATSSLDMTKESKK